MFDLGELSYCDLIAFIGRNNYNNINWWASSISSRSFCASQLWKNILIFLDTGMLKPKKVYSIYGLLKFVAISLYRSRLLAPKKLRNQIHKSLYTAKRKYKHLFISHFVPGAFDWDKIIYTDKYWEPLLNHLENIGDNYIIVGFNHGKEREITKFIINYNTHKSKIIPLEYFVQPFDIILALWHTLFYKPQFPRDIIFRKHNIASLLVRQYEDEVWSGEIYQYLLHYYTFTRMILSLKPERIYWPWENHSWEKMLIIATRKTSPCSRLIGHQHTTIPPYLLNHFPGKGEPEFAPFPDRIITVGNTSLKILNKYGHFPQNCLTAGCNLRDQSIMSSTGLWKRRPIQNIGVALTMDSNASSLLVNELISSFLGKYNFIFRIHPACPKEHIKFPTDSFSVDDGLSLVDFIETSDCLIYLDSTISFHAIRRGMPVICYQIDQNNNQDPLFDAKCIRWSVHNAEQIRDAIDEINSMHPDDFCKLRDYGIKYVQTYFLIPNSNRLDIFIKS